jgi:hypothetical protein
LAEGLCVKPRHAATLTLVGWYLLIPLEGHYDAPFTYWSHYDSYDTAKECSQAQIELIRKIENSPSHAQKPPFNMVKASECIETDDPRLKEK